MVKTNEGDEGGGGFKVVYFLLMYLSW